MKSIDEMFKRRLDCEEVSNEQKSLVLLRCSQMFKKRLRGGVQTSKNKKVRAEVSHSFLATKRAKYWFKI